MNDPRWKGSKMNTRGFARAIALLLACLGTGSWAEAGDALDKKLPSLDGLASYGCVVKGPILTVDHADPAGRPRQVWSVNFWAEHQIPLASKPRRDWKLLYSFRKKRSRSLTDCDKFLERVRKALREHPINEPGQLAAQSNPLPSD